MTHPLSRFSKSALSRTTLVLAALFATQAYAGGYQLFEYNSTDVGLSAAGGAAYAEDASTNFSNPAGLVNVKNPEFVVAGSLVSGKSTFSGQACGGDTRAPSDSPPGLNACDLTDAHDNSGTTNMVPAFHYAMPINDRFFAGLSVTSPFGLSTDYSNDTALRYQATLSQIQTIDINPGIAFKFNDHLSLGAGVSAQSFDGTLSNNFNLAPPGSSSVLPSLGYTDSYLKSEASDWGFGWNLGGLYQFTPGSRFGISYRSQVKHDADGTSRFRDGQGVYTTPLGVTTGSYQDLDTHDSVDITLPATTTISFYQELSSHWAMMASAYYTQWNSIQNLTLKDVSFLTGGGTRFGAPPFDIIPSQGAAQVIIPQNFSNTWRYSLGSEYKLTDAIILRAGGSRDQSPVNNTDRTLRLPDSDRWTGSLGAGYRMSPAIKFDLGYMHIWFPGSASIDDINKFSKSIGEVDASANVYSLEATFDIV